MSIQAEVAGKSADRYRAYKAVKLTRPPSGTDHVNRERAGLPPLPPGSKVRYDGEDVHSEGTSVSGSLSLDAGEYPITRVVFYKGPVEEEVVVGSVEVNASGTVDIELVEPKELPSLDPVIVDAS